MKILQPTWAERISALFHRFWHRSPREPGSTAEPWSSLFQGQMITTGNIWHRWLIQNQIGNIRAEEGNLEEVRQQATQGPVIYVTPYLGQIEYNVFAEIVLKVGLPISQFNNVVRTRRWLAFRQMRKSRKERIQYLARYHKLPDPLESGYLKDLLQAGKSITLSLDDWKPALFQQLFLIQQSVAQPIAIVPCQLIWDKRPKPATPSLIEALFGENERPGALRKIILFFRHAKKNAVVQFGKPLLLQNFQTATELYEKILRSYQFERRTLTGPPLRPRPWFLEKIKEDEAISRLCYALSKARKKPVETFQHLAEKYAKEIVGDIRYTNIEIAVAILHWFFRIFFDGIQTNKEDWKMIKSSLGKGPAILVPNHRSHLDYMLVSYLCTLNNIAVPYIAAGINMAFWPLGTLFRRSGAFFLRRSFEGNTLYKQIFQTYLKILLQEGYLQEFFIEGGRSRTGKLRPPRFGMLSIYSDLMEQKAAPDIHFLPVSITYDRIPEEKSYAEEEEGKPKLKERTRDLFKLTKVFRRRYGRIYVYLDQPISWQETNSANAGAATEEERKTKLVRRLADKISFAINRQVVLTPQSLVASALLWSGNAGVTFPQLEQSYDELLDYIRWKAGKLSQTLLIDPKGSMREALHQFEGASIIKRHHGLVGTFFEIPEKKRNELNFFKNFSIHRYVSLSLFSNLLWIGNSSLIPIRQLMDDFALFQRLFYLEFRFSTQRALHEHLASLYQYLCEKRVLVQEGDQLRVRPEGKPLLKMHCNILRNYLEGYDIAWTVSLVQPTARKNPKDFSKALLKLAREQLILGKLHYPEGIAQTVFENAVQSLTDLGWLTLATKEAKRTKFLLEQFLANGTEGEIKPTLLGEKNLGDNALLPDADRNPDGTAGDLSRVALWQNG